MWIETTWLGLTWAMFREFIRQQWRMWIETTMLSSSLRDGGNSFASNGECGLKPRPATSQPRPPSNSFASNGECGLKPTYCWRCCATRQFIRQQWRMWIETLTHLSASPATSQFIRQQWRMWIETRVQTPLPLVRRNSFASNGECGLKRYRR